MNSVALMRAAPSQLVIPVVQRIKIAQAGLAERTIECWALYPKHNQNTTTIASASLKERCTKRGKDDSPAQRVYF
jgi:hypothetical protein